MKNGAELYGNGKFRKVLKYTTRKSKSPFSKFKNKYTDIENGDNEETVDE